MLIIMGMMIKYVDNNGNDDKIATSVEATFLFYMNTCLN